MPISPLRSLQVVTFGETMLRLSPSAGQGLESAAAYEVFVGGAESNMAIAFARLGGCVGWFSRLPDQVLGHRIAGEVARHGVDTSAIVWAPTGRAGLFFIETGGAPRGNRVVYDRADAAVAHLRRDEVDWDYVVAAEVLFLSGITPALGKAVRDTWHEAIHRAGKAGEKRVLDINYRALLWDAATCRTELEPILPQMDAVICAHRDLITLFGTSADAETAAQVFAETYSINWVVLTLGADGSLAYSPTDGGILHRRPAYGAEPFDRIGSGDAFAAGWLTGWLAGDTAQGLVLGNAAAALKQTYRGDTTWASRADVLDLVENGGATASQVRR